MSRSIAVLALCVLLPTAGFSATDPGAFPTKDRVEYVLDCMRDTPGSRQELLYKCSCAIDAIAERMSYEAYVGESTVANALTIGGERGEVMRGYTSGRSIAKHFREVQAEARKACFLP